MLRSSSKQKGVGKGVPPLPHTVIRPPIDPAKADNATVQELLDIIKIQVTHSYDSLPRKMDTMLLAFPVYLQMGKKW